MQEPSLSCVALKRFRTRHSGWRRGEGARETQNLIRGMWDSRCLKTSKWKCLINTWILESEPEIKMGRCRELHGNRSHQPGYKLGGKAAFAVCVEKEDPAKNSKEDHPVWFSEKQKRGMSWRPWKEGISGRRKWSIALNAARSSKKNEDQKMAL